MELFIGKIWETSGDFSRVPTSRGAPWTPRIRALRIDGWNITISYTYTYIYICINIYMYKYIQDMVISKWYNHNSIYRKERKNHDDVKVHSEVLLFFVYSSHWILKNPAHGSNIWVPSGITLLWKLVHWSIELIMFNWLRGFSNAKKTLCKWLVKSGTWGHQRGHGDFPAVVPRCWMV